MGEIDGLGHEHGEHAEQLVGRLLNACREEGKFMLLGLFGMRNARVLHCIVVVEPDRARLDADARHS